ncbi:MAG: hypothetical protein RBU37_08415 [Myxococcota bacterium]|jgi:hypothetical protein|nr:hypothetical protein [Myxococcota bacterium]
MIRNAFLLCLAQCTLLACGSSVAPIDLRSNAIPIEARRFLADAQDSASVARARRDDARIRLEQTEAWQQAILESETWPSDGGASNALRQLAEERMRLARLLFERAEAEVELAESKLELITAQTAIRNDLALYDLEPLQERADAARERVKRLAAEVEGQQRSIDQTTTQWWSAFGAMAAGGDTDPLYTDFELSGN